MWADEKALYHLYISMIKRCYVTTQKHFEYYGGRGITVCERWRIQNPRGTGFRNFKEDMGPRPAGYTLERRDNNGNYCPDNCEWATRAEQYRNRSSNVWIEYDGRRMIIGDWARETGVRSDNITKRLRRGMPLGMALYAKNLKRALPIKMIEAAAAKKRAQTHCKRGHELPPDRVCRICKRDLMLARSQG